MTDSAAQHLRHTLRLQWRIGFALLLATVGLVVLGMCVGSNGLERLPSFADWLGANVADSATNSSSTLPLVWQIVWDIRLPRTLGAWLAGALLGLAGCLAQGVFRNPLADPYLLGSASGASLGVATAMALFSITPLATWWLQRIGLTGAAFLGAAAAVLLTVVLARGVHNTIRLLLSGVIVGVVLAAITSLIVLLRPELMQTMQAFMLGSTGFVGWGACGLMLCVWLPCIVCAWLLSRLLDGLFLGEATARSLGLPLVQVRAILLMVLALATGAAVAQTGLIGFVGLAAPHLVRGMVRAKHGSLLWLSSMVGGVLLLAADLLARGLLAPHELPVGVLTAVLGGGYLLYLMHRNNAALDRSNQR